MEKIKYSMNLVTQEAPMDCAIACTASLTGLSYAEMRKQYKDGKTKERTTGLYNKDIVAALRKVGIVAKGYDAKKWRDKKIKFGTIVFLKRSDDFPEGHFLLKTKKGWMNPWINYPNMNPAKAGYQKRLPGTIDWIIETDRL